MFAMGSLLCLVVQLSAGLIAPQPPAESAPMLSRLDFKARFGKFDGCFILRDMNAGWTLRYNETRCAQPLSPCSTFKIFNAMAGLEAGVVEGPDTLIKWDGKERWSKAWNHDHTLASAIRDSVLWYFQEVARRIGAERMKGYIDACGYGNRDISGGIDQFWLQSSLTISANQQIDFLQQLYTGRLPFKPAVMETVKKMLVVDHGEGWTLSGKTGSGTTNDKRTLGWFVGRIISNKHEYVFALNISADDGAWGPGARELVTTILGDLGLMPNIKPQREAAGLVGPTQSPDS